MHGCYCIIYLLCRSEQFGSDITMRDVSCRVSVKVNSDSFIMFIIDVELFIIIIFSVTIMVCIIFCCPLNICTINDAIAVAIVIILLLNYAVGLEEARCWSLSAASLALLSPSVPSPSSGICPFLLLLLLSNGRLPTFPLVLSLATEVLAVFVLCISSSSSALPLLHGVQCVGKM